MDRPFIPSPAMYRVAFTYAVARPTLHKIVTSERVQSSLMSRVNMLDSRAQAYELGSNARYRVEICNESLSWAYVAEGTSKGDCRVKLFTVRQHETLGPHCFGQDRLVGPFTWPSYSRRALHEYGLGQGSQSG